MGTVLTVEGNRGVTASASRESSTRQDGDSSEVSSLAASQAEGHGTAVRETEREAELLVDAESILNLLPDGIQERNVLTALVAPAPVETVGSNKDGALLCEGSKTVVRVADDGVHVTVQPVQAKDEAVLALVVIVLGNTERVAALLAVDSDGVDAAVQRGRLSTAGRSCGDMVEEGEEEKSTQCKKRG